MKKFKEFMKKYFNQKVRNIISIFIIIFGITFMYVYSFKRPTYINKIIATNIYKEPANSYFTDQNFYNCVIDNYNKENGTSKSYTDSLSDDELKKISRLRCLGSIKHEEEKITDTSGLEKMTSLTWLSVDYHKLTSIDVSKNTALAVLNVGYNQLTSLDVSKNTALTYLDVSGNDLTSLDVSKNTALTELDVSYNLLTSLDVSENIKLESLYSNQLVNPINSALNYNVLTSLDVSKNTALKKLNVTRNDLTSLDVSSNTALTDLYVGYNRLINFDVSKNTALTELDVDGNDLTSLDVSKNIALAVLDVGYNQLTSLDVSKNTALKKLRAKGNQLTSLDVSKNTALTELDSIFNQLTSLDVSSNTALTDLYVGHNQLTSLDVSKNTALTELHSTYNQLTSLDVSSNTALTDLYVGHNQLTSLDVSKNTALKKLNVAMNDLTSLDVSSNAALIDLNVYGNSLTNLDLSQNPALVQFNNSNFSSIVNSSIIYVGDSIEFSVKFPANIRYELDNKKTEFDSDIVRQDGYKIIGVRAGKTRMSAIYKLYNGENNGSESYIDLGISVIEMTSDKYLIDNDKEYVFTYSDIDSDVIKSNLQISDESISIVIEGSKIKLMDGQNIIKEFKIINVVSDKFNLDNDVLVIDNVDDITCNNCKASIDDTGLVISDNNGNKIYTYKMLKISSDKYKIVDDKIIVFNDYNDSEKIINNIKGNYGSVRVTDDKKVQVIYNDDVVREYGLVGYSSSKYNLNDDLIVDTSKDVIDNIVCYNCDMDIVDNKLVIKYNDEVIKEYDLLTINSEYRIIDDTILVGNDYDDNDLIMSKISVSYGSIKISDDKKLIISDGDTVLREYNLSNEYIDIKGYDVDDNKRIVSKIDIGTDIGVFNGKIETNLVQGYMLFDKDDNLISDRVLRTGDKLRVNFSIKPIDYTLSIRGDVLGTGNPSVEDGKLIARHIIDGNVINGGEYLLAADYDGNGKIKMNDVMRMLKERQ